MCMECWEKYGSPQIDNAAVRTAIAAIGEHADALDANVGGTAHIVWDDWNLDDEDIELCLEWDRDERDDANRIGCEAAVLAALKTLTVAERASVLYHFDYGRHAAAAK